MSYALLNAEVRHLAAPKTFWIPERSQRTSLVINANAQLMFHVDGLPTERMWVRTLEALPNGTYIGKLNNDPLSLPLKWGDLVHFGPEHIIAIIEPSKVNDSVLRMMQTPGRHFITTDQMWERAQYLKVDVEEDGTVYQCKSDWTRDGTLSPEGWNDTVRMVSRELAMSLGMK